MSEALVIARLEAQIKELEQERDAVLAEKDAEIEALKEQQAEDIQTLREFQAKIAQLKSLLTRAADALEDERDKHLHFASRDPVHKLIAELRHAAE